MNNNIPNQVIDNVRESNDIVDVIGEYVQLKKQGRNFVGLCPFHNENSASFSVNKDEQFYHCFGCKKSGNVFTFVMETKTLSFVESVHYLAEKVNISLPELKLQQSTLSAESKTLLAAYEWLTKYYLHFLIYSDTGKTGLDYFTERGITDSTIKRFELGFAPEDSNFTVEFLETKGYHPQTLVKAGILNSRDNETYSDPFRGRVIFPIKNHLGKTVAFGGRAISDEQPKYLNSPEHELFSKGKILYNFDLAKNHIRKQNEVIIFEGYMDVLSSDQAGIQNILATLGTALSESQAKLLKRYVESVILCFDSDEAGLQGSFVAAKLLHGVGCTVKIASVPDNMDPDQYIRQFGAELFKANVIDTSDTYFKFMMNYRRKEHNLSVESERIAFIEETIKQLAMIESQIEREYYVNEVADEFNLHQETIQNQIAQHRRENNFAENVDKRGKYSNTKQGSQIQHVNHQITPAYQNAERKLISYMLNNNYIIEKVQQQLSVNFNMEEHKIILTHLYALFEEKRQVTVSELIDKLMDERLKSLITEIALIPTSSNNTEQEIEDYIHIIKVESKEMPQIRSLKEQLKLLDRQNEPILAAKLGMEIFELQKKLKH